MQIPKKGDVAGTFVLERRLFFDEYLIPHLQEFCKAVQFIPLKNDMHVDPKQTGIDSCISHAIGVAGGMPQDVTAADLEEFLKFNNKAPPQDYKDDYYKLEPIPGQNLAWSWKRDLKSPGTGVREHRYDIEPAPIYRKYLTTSSSEVTIKRADKDSRPRLELKATTTFDHWEGYFGNTNFKWGSEEPPSVLFWGK